MQLTNRQYLTIVLVTVISLLISFYSGFFVKSLLSKDKSSSQIVSSPQLFRPNFIDEIVIITKDTPRKALVLSAIRTFVNKNTTNYTIKVHYFDGKEWTKEIKEGRTNTLDEIPSTDIVPEWKITTDPSYMLKQSITGEAILDSKKIKFDIPVIENEMGIRSFYKYTKFMSEADGTLSIDGVEYPSYILYSRIYSFNPPESLIFTSDPSGIETEWLAIWDESGNFYSIDETIVDNKKTNDVYKAHSLGILKRNDGSVLKSFELNLNKKDRKKYSVNILGNIKTKITVEKQNITNKSINGVDVWHTGIATAFITTSSDQKLNAFGLYESISQ